ncbi:MAG: LacI family transcriptional regulator [Candidatus Bipolaricaulota bacterium]|nr:LacI family transcriptional regulator [Candidatus Bipolaricaulota bacterium]MDW8127209.1 LacI family DNA-binding transcriptional regulator [Candidatus Bipolaricaulota bacterium]
MVTIKDIAKAAGVAPSTVSRALNDSPLISVETKRRIQRLAQRLGYERNELARGLVKGSFGALGLIVPDIINPFFAEITKGVEEAARERGFGVVLCTTEGDEAREEEYLRLLQRKRVDGLILASVTLDDPYLQKLQHSKIPFVLVSRLSKGIEAPYVVVDDKKGGRLATEHLADLGHKHIAFVGGPSNVHASRERMSAYRAVLSERGLPLKREWIVFASFTQEAGREVGRRLLSQSERPTAIFAANDLIALGIMEAAEELGLRIPDDLSLVGYNDIAYAGLPRIQLTTVAQPMREMGQIAANFVLDVVEGRKHASLAAVLAPRLVVRRTTAPPGRS